MNYTEEQILDKGKQILKDCYGNNYHEENIEKAMFDPEKKPIRGEPKIIPVWIIVINQPVFDSLAFLTISDITGEPLYIQTKHMVREIAKDEHGKYFRIDD